MVKIKKDKNNKKEIKDRLFKSIMAFLVTVFFIFLGILIICLILKYTTPGV